MKTKTPPPLDEVEFLRAKHALVSRLSEPLAPADYASLSPQGRRDADEELDELLTLATRVPAVRARAKAGKAKLLADFGLTKLI